MEPAAARSAARGDRSCRKGSGARAQRGAVCKAGQLSARHCRPEAATGFCCTCSSAASPAAAGKYGCSKLGLQCVVKYSQLHPICHALQRLVSLNASWVLQPACASANGAATCTILGAWRSTMTCHLVIGVNTCAQCAGCLTQAGEAWRARGVSAMRC